MSPFLETADKWAPAEPILDPTALRELRGFGDAFLLELIVQFTGETDVLLAELREAWIRNDPATVAHIVRAIKGSAGQLGGLRLTRACNRLERRARYDLLRQGESDLQAVEREYDELSLGLTFAATLT